MKLYYLLRLAKNETKISNSCSLDYLRILSILNNLSKLHTRRPNQQGPKFGKFRIDSVYQAEFYFSLMNYGLQLNYELFSLTECQRKCHTEKTPHGMNGRGKECQMESMRHGNNLTMKFMK